MNFTNGFKDKIFFSNEENFDESALQIYKFQSENNEVYSNYLDILKIDRKKVKNIRDITFMPVEFFKTHCVLTGKVKPVKVFYSSGTTDSIPSRHYLCDTDIYKKASVKGFELFFGDIKQYNFLALLPSYLERNESSLVFMVNEFINRSKNSFNGFYMNDYNNLSKNIETILRNKEKAVLIGVSFALLEYAQKYKPDLSNVTVIETGGMKGKSKDMPRKELHEILKSFFNKEEIYSEYGMTELLSQAYSLKDGVFRTPPWMKVLTRDITDPFSLLPFGEQGALNIIDLANIYSCSFIATSDSGVLINENEFEVTGRLDNSEARGCNLLAGI